MVMKLPKDESNGLPVCGCGCKHSKSDTEKKDLERKILFDHNELLDTLEKYTDNQLTRKYFTFCEIFYALSYNTAVEYNKYFRFLY